MSDTTRVMFFIDRSNVFWGLHSYRERTMSKIGLDHGKVVTQGRTLKWDPQTQDAIEILQHASGVKVQDATGLRIRTQEVAA